MCIQGDNLDSVETSEIRVTVGGEECVKIPSNSRGSDIICTVPLEPPGGQELAIINVSNYLKITVCHCLLQVTIGSNISQVLDRQLTYSLPTFLGPTVPLEIIIPVIVVIFVLVVCLLMIVIVCLYLNSRRKFMSIAMHQQMVELVATTG